MNEKSGFDVGRRGLWIALGLVAAVALVLRLLAARGGLWLDEAWSAWFAREVRTPAGVFLRINHDNNHHLNTLWLQLVGWGAPPVLARGLSIASGTAAAAVAGLILAPRGIVAAAIGGALFAVSPLLLTYGAEARGYAPMLLALLLAVLVTGRALAAEEAPNRIPGLAPATAVGMLGHLTMIFGLAALVGWTGLTLAGRLPLKRAAIATLRITWPAIAASAVVLAIVLVPGALSPGGFQLGHYDPFSFEALAGGLEQALVLGLGLPMAPKHVALVMGAAAAGLALLKLEAARARRGFYILAIFGLPLAMAAVRFGNSGFPRYHLVPAVAMLLLAADVLSAGWAARGWRRAASILALAALLAGATIADRRIVTNRRGDPAEAVTAMAHRAPAGAEVLADGRDEPVLTAAAASAGYRLAVILAPCPPAQFLFRDFAQGEPGVPSATLCGAPYRLIAERQTWALSGMGWRLYERQAPLQPQRRDR